MLKIVIIVFLAAFFVDSSLSLPVNPGDEKGSSLSDYELLQDEYLQTLEMAVNHFVRSRDMRKVLKRDRRQLNNFGGLGQGFGQGSLSGLGQNSFGSFGGGLGGLSGASGLNGLNGAGALGSGALGQGATGLFDGLENLGNLASLQALGAGAAANAGGPLAPVLTGIGTANNVVKTVTELDRMRCMPRLACEYMANRGLFNRTGAIVSPTLLSALPNNTQGALNISNPSTFRTVLGLLQLVRFQEFGAYPHIEAGLWGAAHRDNTRCRNQFTKCPSTSEAFISELNATPGGLQGLFTNAVKSLRNVLPVGGGTAAGGTASAGAPTRITSGLQSANGLNNLGNLGSLSNFGLNTAGALGNNIGNQQLFNPSSLGGNLGAGSLANFGSSFANPSSSSLLNGAGSLGTLGAGTNLNQINFAGLNGANFGSLGQQSVAGTGLNQLSFAGLNGANLGSLGQQSIGGTNLNQLSFANLNGANFGSLGQNGLLLNSLSGVGGQNALLSGAQFSGSQLRPGSLGSTQLGSLGNLGTFQGSLSNFPASSLSGPSFASNPGLGGLNFAGSSFGTQLSPSAFQSTGFGGVNSLTGSFRSGSEDESEQPKKETGKKWKWSI